RRRPSAAPARGPRRPVARRRRTGHRARGRRRPLRGSSAEGSLMSNVRYEFPKYKLTQQLKEPGGVAVADAVDAAKANLTDLEPECISELHKATAAALAEFQRFPSAFDAASLQALYAISARSAARRRPTPPSSASATCSTT